MSCSGVSIERRRKSISPVKKQRFRRVGERGLQIRDKGMTCRPGALTGRLLTGDDAYMGGWVGAQ